MAIEGVREGYRQGGRGNVEEGWLITSSWRCELEEISANHVKIWYGSRTVTRRVGLALMWQNMHQVRN
jgi:hypothetical protein